MKSAIVILIAGLVLCAATFCGFYFAGTASHRGLLHEPAPELAWLKKEFKLSDAGEQDSAESEYTPHLKLAS